MIVVVLTIPFLDAAFHNTVGAKAPEDKSKGLIIAVSSDKGLCGGIHSTITRTIRRHLAVNGNYDLISLGDKCKIQLARTFSDKFSLTFSSLGQKPPTFYEACLVADQVLRLGQYNNIQIYYNKCAENGERCYRMLIMRCGIGSIRPSRTRRSSTRRTRSRPSSRPVRLVFFFLVMWLASYMALLLT